MSAGISFIEEPVGQSVAGSAKSLGSASAVQAGFVQPAEEATPSVQIHGTDSEGFSRRPVHNNENVSL